MYMKSNTLRCKLQLRVNQELAENSLQVHLVCELRVSFIFLRAVKKIKHDKFLILAVTVQLVLDQSSCHKQLENCTK